MNSKVIYHQQVSYCGKPRCRKCREGTGHGPYWYAYQTIDGRTSRTYVGKHLPPDVQAEMMGNLEPPSAHASEREQSTIRIYVLGQFRLERRNPRDPLEWQTVTESAWQHQRVRSLLGALVSVEGRKLGREQLIDVLWPDLELETGGSRLDRSVYSLRQLFEPGRSKFATSPLLLTERELVALASHPQVWIDADVFEQLLARARASKDPGEQERLLEEAASLYGGEFLPEERKSEWARARRESLLRSWIGLMLELADLYTHREALTRAIEPLDKLLAVDPTNEAAVQRQMRVLMLLGRRGEALRAYKKLSAQLQQEFHISPLPETREIYNALRASGPGGKEAPAVSPAPASGNATRAGMPLSSSREGQAVQIGRPHQSPLIGRDREIEALRTLVVTTENTAKFRLPTQKRSVVSSLDPQRRPQCVLLLGDVGIGKTRLAEEVSRDAKRRGWAVAWSRVYAQEGSIPYRLWTEILTKAMEQGAWQRQEVSRRPVVFQPLTALLPDLQNLLPQVSFASPQSPEQEQLRLWEAARELLTLICESTPLLIALDDLQWADNSSCELLAYMARRIYGLPILIVGTCRDNELPANHALRPLLTDLQRENAVETIGLEPLNDEQIDSLVSYIQQVPEPIVQRIRHRAAGNPFFAEELARSIEDRNHNATWNVAGGADEQGLTVLPDTITAVLDLRMNRLSQPCQRLLSKAAVLGGSFPFHVINAMEANTPGSDEDLVLELLEEGLRSGMLTEEGVGTRITYHFWHPLLVNHLYEGLSAARRALLHRRAADILRRVHKGHEEEHAAEILRHLINGGSPADQVAHYAELAGDHAYALSDNPSAEKHYRIALEYMEEEDDWQRRVYIWERLGECIRIRGKFEEARSFFEKILELRQQHIPSSPDERQQEMQIQAVLWCEIGLTWYNKGDIAKAQEYYLRGERVLKDADIVGGPAWAYLRYQQSYIKWREGNFEEARRSAIEALSLFEGIREEKENGNEKNYRLTRTGRILDGDSISLGRTHALLGLIANAVGQYSDALVYYNTALTLYEKFSRQREISIVCCNLGDIHLKKVELSLAQSFFRRSLSIAEQIDDTPSVCVALANLGILATLTGDLTEAENWFKQGIILTERVNDSVYISYLNSYLSLTLQEQGKIFETEKNLHRALTIARSKRIPPCIGLALVILGEMRIIQAVDADIHEKNSEHILLRAKNTLKRAITLQGIEVETRIEGQITLVYVMFLLGGIEDALQMAHQTLEEAKKLELTWLVARAQRVLGDIAVALDQPVQADSYFEQALRTFRKGEMRLEMARTLHHYGEALVLREDLRGRERERGLECLREARRIFAECKAALDLKLVERVLGRYERLSKI